jgi:hypothetical protein
MPHLLASLGDRLVCGFIALAALACTPALSRADSLYFLPANTFSGTAPGGTLSVDFEPGPSTNQLIMTIVSNLATGENLDPHAAVYLNINPARSSYLGNLTFTLQSNIGFSQASTVNQGEDNFKADGDGFYDLTMTYSPGTKAFLKGQSQTYLISAPSGDSLSTTDFTQYMSTSGGGEGTWLAAVHVQNTPDGGSGSAWVGAVTPEPSSFVIAFSSLACIGLAGMLRRLQRAVH